MSPLDILHQNISSGSLEHGLAFAHTCVYGLQQDLAEISLTQVCVTQCWVTALAVR